MNGPVTVRPLESGEEEAWDRFVAACPEATFFHRVGWQRVVEGAYGHRPHYLLAESEGRICGVLPLVHVRSRLFGNALISTPYCVLGGAAACDEASRSALEARAVALARSLDVDWLECRNRHPRTPDWESRALYYTFEREIGSDPEANLKAIPRKQRAEVRRGIQHGLTAFEEADPSMRCYDIYSESVRNLGTPVFPRAMFRLLKEVFGAACEGLLIRHQDRVVAAVVSFYFRDRVLPYYGGGIREARSLGAMAFMYWELMSRASARGARVFDFGRSKAGSGSFDFKRYYGFDPEPLHYRYHLVKAMALPEINPSNPKYRLFIEAWKRLPLPLSRRIGPWLSRGLG